MSINKNSTSFENVDKLIKHLNLLYDQEIHRIQDAFEAFKQGKKLKKRVRGFYPYVEITVEETKHSSHKRSYGFLRDSGTYRMTVTRPNLYKDYYKEQFGLLLKNHKMPITVGLSDEPIPVHFAYPTGIKVDDSFDSDRYQELGNFFDLPDLKYIDDQVVNGRGHYMDSTDMPLSFFSAPRVDFSLHRLQHYTATNPEHFQNFVLYTNYQFYIDEFVALAKALMQKTDDPELLEISQQYTHFVEPGNNITFNQNLSGKVDEGEIVKRLPQMPAYHLCTKDHMGITMVNMGVGPSNAKTITDHVAVLRSCAWIMLGHCAGLRSSQNLGDYVLAHGYVREDHVLDDDLPLTVPLPPLAEIQIALQQAVSEVTQKPDWEVKKVMRTGTVVTVDNRNWETNPNNILIEAFNQSRAIALDMESATIAGNGFRYRVPYGTLLCVSDKPLHGELKLAGMANEFYKYQVDQHLKIGVRTMEILRNLGKHKLHSRKLRGFLEPPLQ